MGRDVLTGRNSLSAAAAGSGWPRQALVVDVGADHDLWQHHDDAALVGRSGGRLAVESVTTTTGMNARLVPGTADGARPEYSARSRLLGEHVDRRAIDGRWPVPVRRRGPRAGFLGPALRVASGLRVLAGEEARVVARELDRLDAEQRRHRLPPRQARHAGQTRRRARAPPVAVRPEPPRRRLLRCRRACCASAGSSGRRRRQQTSEHRRVGCGCGVLGGEHAVVHHQGDELRQRLGRCPGSVRLLRLSPSTASATSLSRGTPRWGPRAPRHGRCPRGGRRRGRTGSRAATRAHAVHRTDAQRVDHPCRSAACCSGDRVGALGVAQCRARVVGHHRPARSARPASRSRLASIGAPGLENGGPEDRSPHVVGDEVVTLADGEDLHVLVMPLRLPPPAGLIATRRRGQTTTLTSEGSRTITRRTSRPRPRVRRQGRPAPVPPGRPRRCRADLSRARTLPCTGPPR